VEDLEAFARLVTALRPWLGQLVVVGGWAQRLHRFHRLAKPPGHLPLRTRDTDLAFSPEEALGGDLRAALAEAGFTEEFFGDDSPPATHYRLGGDDAGFYVEFLTPLLGSDVKRGKRDATMSKAGVTAQKLRYLDMLLVKPWSVRVGPEQDVPIASGVDLLVPNPTSFIVQKLLIHPDRPRDKRAQDVLYIHDTLELFGSSLGELRRLWLEEVRPTMPAKTTRRAEAVARELFAEVTDMIRDAARIPQDRRLAPEDVQRACRYGLAEVLGIPEAD
jgi:hypothetical protein